jgi:hypothetical protein
MKITFAPRGILQMDDVRIVYRNFSGAGSKYNREGDRNFSVVIDDEDLANQLIEDGWNIKIRPPRDEDDIPFMHLPVKVKFNDRGPGVYLISGRNKIELDEESVSCLDEIDIAGVDLDVRPYDWEVNGKSGRTAYLHSIQVVQEVNRFATDPSVGFGE